MQASFLPLPGLGLCLATYEAGNPRGPALLFLHGNSLSADIFGRQWEAPELQQFRLVAIDLPGHGQSGAAPGHYALPAMRAVVLAAVRALRLEEALVVAHSYSGHLLYELLPALPTLRGALVVSAPPISSVADTQLAFRSSDTVLLYYAAAVTAAQAGEMARYVLRPDAPTADVALLAADIRRTDGRARTGLGASLGAGAMGDEVGHVARTAVPLALVAGALDVALQLDYFETLAAPSRWGQPVHLVPGARHTPFLESPAVFNQLLLDFAGATTSPRQATRA